MSLAKIKEAVKNGQGLRWEGPAKRCLGHRMVITLAMKIANEEYERYVHDNAWYKANPSRKRWVLTATPFYTEPARATLAKMLSGNTPEHLKREIHTALLMDNQFRGKRNASNVT